MYFGSVVRPYREGLSTHEAPNIHNVSLLSLSRCEHTENVGDIQPINGVKGLSIRCEHTENVGGEQQVVV